MPSIGVNRQQVLEELDHKCATSDPHGALGAKIAIARRDNGIVFLVLGLGSP